MIRKFLKDIQVLPSEKCITQYQPLIFDFKMRKVKDIRTKFLPRKKIFKLHEDSVKKGVVKHGGGMMLIIVLVRSGTYGRNGNSRTQDEVFKSKEKN